MIDLQGGVRRVILESHLDAIHRIRSRLDYDLRSLPAVQDAPQWTGPARRQFDANLEQITALWNETRDALAQAEQHTRRALNEAGDDGE
jgi:uncharacterized protein YukE